MHDDVDGGAGEVEDAHEDVDEDEDARAPEVEDAAVDVLEAEDAVKCWIYQEWVHQRGGVNSGGVGVRLTHYGLGPYYLG